MNITSLCCLAVMAGLFCGIQCPAVNICLYAAGFTGVFILKMLIYRGGRRANLFTLLIAGLFFLSCLWGFLYHRQTFDLANSMIGQDIVVEGTVTRQEDNYFVLTTEDGSYAIYYGGEDGRPNICDIVKIRGKFSTYPVREYRGAIDKKLYYGLRGICGKISCKNIEIMGKDRSFSLKNFGTAIRNFINERIEANGRFSNPGFIKALLTGTVSDLDSDIREDFSITGISHLLAVSGLHFGVFLSFFSMVTANRRRKNIGRYIITFLLIAVYVLMIGDRASVFRAAIMAAASYGMTFFRRRNDPLTNLMFAGLAICFINPLYVTDAGFQMSFLATFGITVFSGYFSRQFIAVPVISMLFMLPITTYYSNVISLGSIFVNIIAVAVMPAVVIFGYLSCIVPVFGIFANGLGQVITGTAELFADIDFLHFTVSSPEIWVFAVWAILAIIVYFILEKRGIADIGVLILCLFAMVSYSYASEATPYLHSTVNFVNIGSNNMEHIVTEGGKDIFIDCGFNTPGYAEKTGVHNIYMVVITEAEESKYGGLEKLCNQQNVQAVIMPEEMRNFNLKLENSQIIYYNKGNFKHRADNVTVKSMITDGKTYFGISVYGKNIMIPLDTKKLDKDLNCLVLAVPDNCTGLGEYVKKSATEFYIHSTFDYEYYDYGNKYITSQIGATKLVFKPDGSLPVAIIE